jgi:uncharacterized coiled-coil protein SlyX
MNIHIYHHHSHDLVSIHARLDTVVLILNGLSKGVTRMAGELDALNTTMTALEAKTAETNKTLLDLAALVVALQSAQPGNLQAEIAALTARAQKILDDQTAAEDTADNALVPPVEVPVDPPVNP